MLFAHCGMQRTGTSSLQAVLARQREALAAAGVDYPLRWRVRDSHAHYGLVELLKPSPDREAALADLRAYLSSVEAGTVLLSSEGLASWLSEDRLPALLNFLRAAQAEVPVTCIWTLRSADEFLASMYLHQIMFGYRVPAPSEYFLENMHRLAGGMARMRQLEQALCTDFIYVKYEEDGSHNTEILTHVGLPADVRETLLGELRLGPRLNPSLSRKSAAAMLHIDAISTRAGMEVTRANLKQLAYVNAFRFQEDGPCVLVENAVRRHVHEVALSAAYECGFAPYIEFFERHEIEAASPTSTEPSVLTDEDIEQLMSHLSPRA